MFSGLKFGDLQLGQTFMHKQASAEQGQEKLLAWSTARAGLGDQGWGSAMAASLPSLNDIE